MRRFSPRRRRLIALCALPACLTGAFGTMHQHLKHLTHGNLYEDAYLAVLCGYVVFLMRETVKMQREEGCRRA